MDRLHSYRNEIIINEIIFCITNEISFTIISLSSSDKFFLESRFFIRNYYFITNYFFFYFIMISLLFLLFLVSEGLLFVSFFWTSFHSLSSPSFGGFWTGFYVPDPCELTFANTLLLSNAAIS